MRKLITALALFAAFDAYGADRHFRLSAYVDKRMPKIIEQQKKRFNLTYNGEPEMPSVVFASITDDDIMGSYSCGENKVTLDHFKLLRAGPEQAENTANHESAHHNNCKIMKRLRTGPRWTLPERLVDEGTATYIADTMTDFKTECRDFRDLKPGEYDRSGGARRNLIYDVGSCITGQIVEMYGERGIEHMFANLPTAGELRNPYSYTARMLRELAAAYPRF